MDFKIGDKVKCINQGCGYSEYKEKVEELGLTKWKQTSMSDGEIGIIVAIKDAFCGVRVGEQDYLMSSSGLELIQASNYKPKIPTHLVIWDTENVDPHRFFTDEKETDDFIKELMEKSNVKQDSIILIEIKTARRIKVVKQKRSEQYKI